MNDDLEKLILENQRLIKDNLELSQKNAKKIKQVHAYMRRTFLAKITYWIVIVLVTAGALYFVKPYFESALKSYESFSDKLNTTSEIIENPASLFKDVGILNSFFGS